MNAHYVFKAQPDLERYETLPKSSRFAAITKAWGGSLNLNVVEFSTP